jgi:hypothetical protein
VNKKDTSQIKQWTYDSERNCESLDHQLSGGGISNNVTSREVKSKDTVDINNYDYAED